MKNFFAKPLLFALLLFSCQQPDIEFNAINLPKVAYTSLGKEEKLSQAIHQIALATKGNRSSRLMSELSNINPDSILKVLQSNSFNYSYTLPIGEMQKSNSFKNLVLRRVSNGFYVSVVEYTSRKSILDMRAFIGSVKEYNLEGTLLREMSIGDKRGGRVSECGYYIAYRCLDEGVESSATGTTLPCLYKDQVQIFQSDCGGNGSYWNNSSGSPNLSFFTFIADVLANGGGGGTGSGGGLSGGSNTGTSFDGNNSDIWQEPFGVVPTYSIDELKRIITDALVVDMTNENLLDAQQNDKLKEAFSEVYKKCPNKVLIEALHQSGFKFKFKIDASMTTPGGFDPATNSIKFRSTNDINYTTLQEELFHAYQHLTTSIQTQLNAPYVGRSNVEFESKVYADIVCRLAGDPCQSLGGNSEEYTSWIIEITDGWTKFPTWPKMQPKYFQFLEKFIVFNPSYSFPIDYNLIPQASFKAFAGC